MCEKSLAKSFVIRWIISQEKSFPLRFLILNTVFHLVLLLNAHSHLTALSLISCYYINSKIDWLQLFYIDNIQGVQQKQKHKK